jgi:acyl-CoA thioester hydrolase
VETTRRLRPASARPARTAPRLEDFPYRAADSIRLGDLDHQNHVNNAVFSTYFETGRVMMMRALFGGLNFGGANFVLARVEIDFLREVHWPGHVDIGTRVARVGTSSLTLDQTVFKDGTCAASGRSTMVLIDSTARRATPFPQEMAGRLRGGD